MFPSTLNLFSNILCPNKAVCTRHQCIFSHKDSPDLPPPTTLDIPVDEPKTSQAEQRKIVPAKRAVNSSPVRTSASPLSMPNEPPRKLQKLDSQRRIAQNPTPVSPNWWMIAQQLTYSIGNQRSAHTKGSTGYFICRHPRTPSSSSFIFDCLRIKRLSGDAQDHLWSFCYLVPANLGCSSNSCLGARFKARGRGLRCFKQVYLP